MARLHKVWVERSQADSAERNESVPFTCHQENWDGDDTAATLVIHDIDTEHERVFTESEVRASAMAEPELPDEMPDEMWEACKSDRATMQEALRVVVRLTRDGILGRLLDPA